MNIGCNAALSLISTAVYGESCEKFGGKISFRALMCIRVHTPIINLEKKKFVAHKKYFSPFSINQYGTEL